MALVDEVQALVSSFVAALSSFSTTLPPMTPDSSASATADVLAAVSAASAAATVQKGLSPEEQALRDGGGGNGNGRGGGQGGDGDDTEDEGEPAEPYPHEGAFAALGAACVTVLLLVYREDVAAAVFALASLGVLLLPVPACWELLILALVAIYEARKRFHAVKTS